MLKKLIKAIFKKKTIVEEKVISSEQASEYISVKEIISKCWAENQFNFDEHLKEYLKKGFDNFIEKYLFSAMNKEFSFVKWFYKREKFYSAEIEGIQVRTSKNFYYNKNTEKAILYVQEVEKWNITWARYTLKSETIISKHKQGNITDITAEAFANCYILHLNGLFICELSIVFMCLNGKQSQQGLKFVDSIRLFSSDEEGAKFLGTAKEIIEKKVVLMKEKKADSLANWNKKKCSECIFSSVCSKETEDIIQRFPFNPLEDVEKHKFIKKLEDKHGESKVQEALRKADEIKRKQANSQ